ncbi:hypothetical protein CCP3SC5AM1_550002 [Gammaproteobacteria bacterium]
MQKSVIKLKILHKSLENILAQGVKQAWKYLDCSGTKDGHLVISTSWQQSMGK